MMKDYDACLFFCHLTLEKLLKAFVVRETKDAAPFIHNLLRLAHLAKIDVSDERMEQLKIITSFHIAGRYGDEKLAFHKQCTRMFTEPYYQQAKRLYLWLKKEFPKK